MPVPIFHQRIKLEIAHHGIELYHGIAHRSSGGKRYAPAPGDLVHVAALAKHIAGFLRVCLCDTRHVSHFCVEEQILKTMRFVHKQAVNAQFLKRYYAVFLVLRRQFLQLYFQIFLRFFHLLDGVTLSAVLLRVGNGGNGFVNLILNDGLLPLRREGNLLKLGVSDNYRVIVAGGDTGAEFLAVGWLKVFLGSHQHLRAGIQTQKIAAPLLRQVVGDDEQGFLAQAQPFALHSRSNHFKGFARADTVGQQGVLSIEDMGHGVFLVGPQADLRRHAREADVGAVVLAGANVVKQRIVLLTQCLPAFRVFEYPIFECLTDGFLLLLGNHGLFLIEDPGFLSVYPLFVKYPHIPLVKGVLENFIGIGALCAVGCMDFDIILAVRPLVQHPPFAGSIGVEQLDFIAAQPPRCLQQVIHKLLVVFLVNP